MVRSRRSNALSASSGARRGSAVTGSHTSAANSEGDAPRKSFGPTPMMVVGYPLMRTDLPTMAGSEPRCSRQYRSLITTAGARPGRSYDWSKNRPSDGRTPSVEKYDGVTNCPQPRSVRPPLEIPNGTGATYAKVDENKSFSVR